MRSSIYLLSQKLLAFDADQGILRHLRKITQLPIKGRVLDVGCGPSSRLKMFHEMPIGVDLDFDYIRRMNGSRGKGISACATSLPFKSGSFDGVFSFGLLHHLDHASSRQAICEMDRVTTDGGWTIIFDGVFPENGIKRPLAWMIRQWDQGNWMRSEVELENIFDTPKSWNKERFTYSTSGLEGVFIWRKKTATQ